MKITKEEQTAARILHFALTVVVIWSIFAHFDGIAAWGLMCAFLRLGASRRRFEVEGDTE